MLEKIEKLYKELDEVMEFAMSNAASMNMLKHMDAEEFKFIQLTLRMYDSAKEISIEQAIIIEEQNKKLDKILRLLEMKSE